MNDYQPRPYDVKNPYLAPILVNKELHKGGDRSCMHIELDISESKIRYAFLLQIFKLSLKLLYVFLHLELGIQNLIFRSIYLDFKKFFFPLPIIPLN